MTESKEHIKLKRKAKKFLKSLGFEDITTEHDTGIFYCGHYFSSHKEARVDVVGFKGCVYERTELTNCGFYLFSWNRIALVECGSTPEGKLRTLARHFEEVYQLPYGREIERVKRVPKREWWELE